MLITLIEFIIFVAIIFIIYSVENKKEEKLKEQEAQQRIIAERKRKEQEEAKQKAYRDSLVKKYSNSSVTKEILEMVKSDDSLPFTIEIQSDRITFSYENRTNAYVFKARGLPNLIQEDEKVFADVLNQKLDNKYSVRENTKLYTGEYSDGEKYYNSIYISTILELKTTRTF